MQNRNSIALGFLAVIALGAIFLASPLAQATGNWGRVFEAIFTATSAVCVTGLTVVEVGVEYSRTGLIGLLVLVEIGCVGLMTLGTFFMLAIGRRLSISSEFSLMDAYGVPAVKGIKGLIVWIVGSMLSFQALGAALLYWRSRDLFEAVFYSIMNFCNAGFSYYPGSLEHFQNDYYSVFTMTALTILGGVGFLVLYNLVSFKYRGSRNGARGRLTLHTKTVLRFTAYLLIGVYAAFLIFEWSNSLANMPTMKKLLIGFFQAATPRTCGFCFVPTENLQPITRFVYEVMMMIGGGPGSAAGGIKITTLAVLIYTLTAMCRGDTETIIDRKTISTAIVRESIVIVTALVSLIVITTGALIITENPESSTQEALFFEAVSAITTTGLSIGNTTPNLSDAGRIVIMIAMFLGRLGALTVVMMIGDKETVRHVRYPNEELVVG